MTLPAGCNPYIMNRITEIEVVLFFRTAANRQKQVCKRKKQEKEFQNFQDNSC